MTSNKKAITVLAILGVVALALVVGSNWVTIRADEDDENPVGTWLTVSPFPAVVTFHDDGTLTSSDASDFGGPPFTSRDTPLRGIWAEVNDGSFEFTSLAFSGNAMSGGLEGIFIVRGTVQVESDNLTIEGVQETFTCPTLFTCPDPLTAEPDDVSAPFSFQATRLRLNGDGDEHGNDNDD